MRSSTLVSFAVVAFATTAVTADTIDLRYTGHGHGRNAKVNLNGNARDVFAGELFHELSNGTGSGIQFNGQTLTTFCPDLTETVTDSGATYSIVSITDLPTSGGQPPMGADKAQAIADIFPASDGSAMVGSSADDFFSAFQILIWEIVSDYNVGEGISSVNLDHGSLVVTKTDGNPLSSGVMTEFNNLVGQIGSGGVVGQMVGFANDGSQDQMFRVPTPGTLAISALGALVATRRRRG